MKKAFEIAAVVVAGVVLGSFVGALLPSGHFRDVLTNDISAGLHTTSLDLRIVDLTFGCMFHFDLLSIAGVVAAAFLYKRVLR